jgi:hypothetical protein
VRVSRIRRNGARIRLSFCSRRSTSRVSVQPSVRDAGIPLRPEPGALSSFACIRDTWRSCVPTRPSRTGAGHGGPADDYRRIAFA